MSNAANNSAASEMVFTMGLPGAGKSTILGKLGLLDTHTVIDPDAHKALHPDYDPKAPELLHAWSSLEAEKEFQAACASAAGQWIVDGTGTNSDKMVRRIRQAQAQGFTCRVVYVRVTLETALERNAARTRTVPAHIVHEKSLDINTAIEIVSYFADGVLIVDND